MPKIAIIGATGMIGRPVTHQFIRAGYDVTLLARSPERAERIFGSDTRILQGDLKDAETVRSVLAGQENLYLNLSVDPTSSERDFQPEREGLDHILEAVKDSTVRRIGYLSSLVQFYQGQNNFRSWVFDIKLKAVEKIKNSGVAYSIFYASTFMESFNEGAYRQGNFIVLAGTSNHKMFLISGADYGRWVVKAFEYNIGNHEYVVQGPEGYTADEAAKFLTEHYAKTKLRIIKAPLGVLKFLGRFSNKLNYGASIIEALNNYPEKFKADQTWDELGRPKTTFIEYIQNA